MPPEGSEAAEALWGPAASAGRERLTGGAGSMPHGASPFCHALLRAGARHLAGEDAALAAFVRQHFPHLVDRRDRAAAVLALEHAVCGWLPGAEGPEAEVRVRNAVEAAVRRAERLEAHWQAKALLSFLPPMDPGADLEQAEGRIEAERLIARAAVTPGERALLRRLAADDGGWSAVRRDLPPDLRVTDEAFYRWQRAARQRWQRALARLVGPR